MAKKQRKKSTFWEDFKKGLKEFGDNELYEYRR